MKNVLLISLDAVRADYLKCYGGHVSTPNIDKLAESGVLFNKAFSSYGYTPVCMYSILTGLSPMSHGYKALRWKEDYSTIPAIETSLPQTLKQKGYRTGAVTSISILDRELGFDKGFDFFHRISWNEGEKKNHRELAEGVNRHAIDFINSAGNDPFFLWVHYFDAHSPYAPPEEFLNMCDGKPYEGEILYLDYKIGELLKHIDAKKTTIVLTSDHGESFGEHGLFFHENFYDEVLRIPLIISDQDLPSTVINQLVRSVDIAPTLIDLVCGISPAYINNNLWDGQSLKEIIENKHYSINLEAYCGIKTEDNTVYAAIRTDNYKFLLDGLTAGLHGVEPIQMKRMFYNLDFDPRENMNLMGGLQIATEESLCSIAYEFPTLDLKNQISIAEDLEKKLLNYLNQKPIRVSELKEREKYILEERLRSLGYMR